MNDRRLSVIDWLSGKSVLITGGTGFVGKVLIEKLLRTCPQINCIYVLVRPKKSMSPQQRLEAMLELPIYDNIRKSNPNLFSKLICIDGDLSLAQLGLDINTTNELTKTINIIFHMAASVRFDLNLKTALAMNTVSTQNVLDLAVQMNKLEVFAHVSTAYCQCTREFLEEKIYTSNAPPVELIELMKWAKEEQVAPFVKKLIDGFPNTYSYTKNLTETLVASYSNRIPIAVARPSIVTASLKEPIRGWIDNLNGPTGLMVGAGKGVIRTMLCNPNYLADCIPVDLVANGVILSAWEVGTTVRKPTPLVVNLVMSENSVTWGEIIENCRKIVHKYPLSTCLWYPGGSIKTSKVTHTISLVLFHFIPAILMDLLLILLRKKPFMIRIQKKIQHGLNMLQFYTIRQWKFENRNWKRIYASLDNNEKQKFYTNETEINWFTYLTDYLQGVRLYCLHDNPDTIPEARRAMQKYL